MMKWLQSESVFKLCVSCALLAGMFNDALNAIRIWRLEKRPAQVVVSVPAADCPACKLRAEADFVGDRK